MPNEPNPADRAKTPEEQIREAVNNAAVTLVAQGFDAIDKAAKYGTDWLKQEIIKGISPPRRRSPK